MISAGEGWGLAERSGLSAGPQVICNALRAQRERFAAHLAQLEPSEWSAPTRCTEWSVHHIARHMVDTAQITAGRLAGRPARFPSDAPFDPRTTPTEWLDQSSSQSPEETLAALRTAIRDEHDCFVERIAAADDGLDVVPTGRHVHWSVLPLHVFWDAWLHERDVLLPAGIEPAATPDEVRLAVMYGLLVAGVPPAAMGDPLSVSFHLDGGDEYRYALSCQDGELAITAAAGSQPTLRGDALAVVDSLIGRGPEVAEVLDGPTAVVDKLSWLRAFMLAP